MAEWLKAPHSKCGIPERVSGVQILSSPQMYTMKNNFFNLKDYQIIPEASRISYFNVAEVIANYCWQKHNFLPINTVTIVQYKKNAWRTYLAVKSSKHFQNILQRFKKNPSLLPKIENFITDVRENTIKYINKPLDILSNQELGNYLAFYYLQTQELHKAAMTLRLIDRGSLDYFQSFFISQGIEDKSSVLSSSLRQTFTTQENIFLLKLAIKVANGLVVMDSDIYNKKLQEIHDKFCWLTLGYSNEPVQTIHDYKKRMKILIKKQPKIALHNINRHIVTGQRERNKILKKTSKEFRLVADIAAESTYLKDYFKFSVNKMQYYGEAIFKEISRRKKISIFSLKNLAHQDAVSLITNGAINKKAFINSYLRHTVFVSLTGKIRECYMGVQADKYEKLYLVHNKNTSGEFKGRSACKGVARGTARVVCSPNDFHKIKRGDIIIVMNTSPDYVPILSRVGAIVAEEGGITAHVSVISREMKVPCVVGVPHVTKEIKDGDYLEVNADKGEVKVLKQK